ncbi:hypothetical protein GCM10010449_06190 [Streptomyces rectiviolaceus]|uniref:ATP-dependent DNA ligase family profile domain-containing protein n=2 Tax=Streptomyces rectiviolaceus TaxID=332591 RepID=A0ABP6M717_9ACTN
MLARPVGAMPRQPDLQYDAKGDGYGAIVFARPGAPHLQSRNGSDLGPAFPEITRAAAGLAEHGTVVLDGELVVHEGGRLGFGLLQARARCRGRSAVEASARNPAHLIFPVKSRVLTPYRSASESRCARMRRRHAAIIRTAVLGEGAVWPTWRKGSARDEGRADWWQSAGRAGFAASPGDRGRGPAIARRMGQLRAADDAGGSGSQ